MSRKPRLAAGLASLLVGWNAWGGGISGRVTGPDATTPIAGIAVDACRLDDYTWFWASTAADGTYSIGELPAGTYIVQFSDYGGTYAGEFYDNRPSWSQATHLYVGDDVPTQGIDASLALASRISGTVTAEGSGLPLQGIRVSVWLQDGYSWMGWSTLSASDGTYEFGGLIAGTYIVSFADDNGTYVEEFYNNQLGWDNATQFPVSVGATVAGIDAAMAAAGSLKGRVTASDTGLPLSDVLVYAHRWSGSYWAWAGSANTDSDGRYVIDGLAAGDYRVGFDTWGMPYIFEYYDNAYAEQDAVPVPVTAGDATTGVDAALDLPGGVSGRVASDGEPLAGADVWLRREGSDEVYGHARTAADGSYVFEGVIPGDDYQVKADAPGFAARWWRGADHRDACTRVSVASGRATQDVSFDLPPGVGKAFVSIVSSPDGADVFLDCAPLGEVTPLQLQLQPAASHPLVAAASHAPYVVTVRDARLAWPEPRDVNPVEGETVEVAFSLTSASGAIQVITSPEGADVYVDTTEAAVGRTPAVIDNLEEGLHRVVLRCDGFLAPRPIDVFVTAGDTNVVSLPLVSAAVADGLAVNVKSRRSGATVHLDGLPERDVTDLVVTGLDGTHHAGADWWTASHVVWVYHQGSTQPSPMQGCGDESGQTLWFVEDGLLVPLWPEAIQTLERRPRFVWTEAWGAHGYEVRVVDGGSDIEVFSSGLLPMHQLDWSPPDDLPDGEYKWYVRRWLGQGFDDWVEGYAFEVVSLSIVPDELPAGRVGIPFSATLSSLHGLAPVAWFSRLGRVTHYTSTWTDTQYLPGQGGDLEPLEPVAVINGNDQYASFSTTQQTLPFALPFYGQLYDTVWVDSNGRIDFAQGASDYAAALSKLALQPSVAAYWTDLFTENGVLLFAEAASDRVAFLWWAEQTVGRSTVPVFFTAVHWFDGRIDIGFDGEGLGAVVGLSAGDGAHLDLPEQSFAGECPMGHLSFTPVALPAGMVLTPDGILEGTPQEAGDFELVIEARDAMGQTASRMFVWTVQPESTAQPPSLAGTTPPQGNVNVLAAEDSVFTVHVDNPDNVAITYAWLWNGLTFAGSAAEATLAPAWSDSGTTGSCVCVIAAAETGTELTATWQVAVAADNDGDGIRNVDENRLETDPKDPASVFRILGCDAESGQLRVMFYGAMGVTYQPERTTGLPAPPESWEPACGPVSGTGGATNVPVASPPGSVQGYYRVRALLD